MLNVTGFPDPPPVAVGVYVPPTAAGLGGLEVNVIACAPCGVAEASPERRPLAVGVDRGHLEVIRGTVGQPGHRVAGAGDRRAVHRRGRLAAGTGPIVDVVPGHRRGAGVTRRIPRQVHLGVAGSSRQTRRRARCGRGVGDLHLRVAGRIGLHRGVRVDGVAGTAAASAAVAAVVAAASAAAAVVAAASAAATLAVAGVGAAVTALLRRPVAAGAAVTSGGAAGTALRALAGTAGASAAAAAGSSGLPGRAAVIAARAAACTARGDHERRRTLEYGRSAAAATAGQVGVATVAASAISRRHRRRPQFLRRRCRRPGC